MSCGKNGDTPSDESEKETSSNVSSETSGEIDETDNLAYNCPYFYDCGIKITGDDHLSLLTDGDDAALAEFATSLDKGSGYTIAANDWNGVSHNLTLDNSTAAVSVDFGFMSDVTGFEVVFGEYSGKKCEIFYSTDGYNYSFYAGEHGVYENGRLTAGFKITAKSVMFVFPITPAETVKISEIRVYGSRGHDRMLLSAGASYEIDGTVSTKFAESDSHKLTDGITAAAAGEDAALGFTSSAVDSLTGKSGSVITFDLGKVKNVSEVYFGVYTPSYSTITLPDRIDVRYSADGESWSDLGQSFLTSSSGKKGSASQKYLVTRPYTVEARYIKVFTYTTSLVILDEVYIYGSDTPVAEPDYGFINRKNQLSNTNVASFVKASLNGKESALITDLLYATAVSGVAGENTVVLELGKSRDDLYGACVTFAGEVTSYELYCGETKIDCESYTVTVGANTMLYLFFDGTAVDADSVTVKLNTAETLKLKEIAVYAGQPQLPLIRGGFFQLQTNGAGYNTSANNSDYSWYLQLKGMKDLGMDYVVMQYTVNYTARTTLVNGANITGGGYTYTPTYGSADLYEAVLSAADRLGMKVFLGTIHDSDFTSPIANMESYKNIVNDSFLIIKDIYDMYREHASFAGYYLSDEECDQWLNMTGGVNAGRYVYKNQSDYIHEIAPEALVMIAPAIWQSGAPLTGADNLYRLIAADEEGGRPVADIVAAQDCLGRLPTLYVEDAVYNSYESYASEWAKAVRRAGAEFWHDMEIFEVVSTSKRYVDIVKSLGTEAKMSGSIIVFDIPHYFTTFPMASFDSVSNYYKRLIMRDYVRYYSRFAKVDAYGQSAEAVEVVTDDGRKVDTSNVSEVTKPEIKTDVYHEGVLTRSTPTFETISSLNWQNFAAGNNAATPQYAYAYDDDNFYAVIRPNDTTASYGKGEWWAGKDDLIQVWMITTGRTGASTLENDHGIRYYLHRTSGGWQAGGTASVAVSISGFSFKEKDGVIIITMPWPNLGRDVPEVGEKTAMGIKVQYIDGADASWAATDGSKDQSVNASALFSY